MGIVNVETDTLKECGDKARSNLNLCEELCTGVLNIQCNISSFNSFKSTLQSKLNTFKEHSGILETRLKACADELVQVDTSIGSVAEQMVLDIERIETESAKVESTKKTTSIKTTTATVSDEYVNPYDPDNLPDITLYDSTGVLTFYQNGKFVKETFCPDSLKHSYDLKFLILKMGYDAGYWVREDGVQMWGDDVMYGGVIPRWGPGGIEDENLNPSGTTRRRGDKVYGTSGPGRIVGYGGTCEWAALGNFYYRGQKVDETYDVYTRWHIDRENGDNLEEYVRFRDQWFDKSEAHATRNVIDDPPLDPSQRFYQSNESWVSLFETYTITRDYIPDGVVDWSNPSDWKNFDWVSYFQINNPDKL